MSGPESRAWVALVSTAELLPAALDAQLTADAGLINFEYGLLGSLLVAGDEGVRMGALASALHSPAPRLSKAVTRLESRSLVERIPCPSDGRAITVRLTREGRRVWLTVTPPHLQLAREGVLGALAPEQLNALADLLEVVLARLDPGRRYGRLPSSDGAVAD